MTETMSEGDRQGAKRQQKAIGTVVSAGGDKTARVVVQRLVKHPKYGKFMRRDTKLAVHDPQNAAKVGDKVEVAPCRPISKTKSWRLVRVIEKSRSADKAVGAEQQRDQQ